MTKLSQQEADYFIGVHKRLVSTLVSFPDSGEKQSITAIADEVSEEFLVDINRRSIALLKCSYQLRVRTAIPLVRLDIHATHIHQNPNGEVIPTPHIHLYQEGFGLKWAYPITLQQNLPTELIDILHWFLAYCNISSSTELQRRLFQ